MKNLLGCKKGQQVLYITVFSAVIALFMIGVVSIFAYFLTNAFFVEMDATGFSNPDIELAESKFLAANALFDEVIVFLLGVVIVSVGIMGYRNPQPAIMFLGTFLMAFFLGFVSYFFNYIFSEIVSQAVFTTTLGVFPKTILVCTNLHWISLVMLIVGSITAYTRRDVGVPI